jgi:hypothetical protein
VCPDAMDVDLPPWSRKRSATDAAHRDKYDVGGNGDCEGVSDPTPCKSAGGSRKAPFHIVIDTPPDTHLTQHLCIEAVTEAAEAVATAAAAQVAVAEGAEVTAAVEAAESAAAEMVEVVAAVSEKQWVGRGDVRQSIPQ